MDRLGRDTRDLYNIVAEITDKGAALEFVNENITVDKKACVSDGLVDAGDSWAFVEFERRRIKNVRRRAWLLSKPQGSMLNSGPSAMRM
jgi:DNA invertase Pin-like site-specific DNA recombinase